MQQKTATMPEMKSRYEAPDGKPIVAMTVFRNQLYVATQKCVYRLNDDDKLESLLFVSPMHGTVSEAG